jgi:hypothetical protein
MRLKANDGEISTLNRRLEGIYIAKSIPCQVCLIDIYYVYHMILTASKVMVDFTNATTKARSAKLSVRSD